ncbi:MAG TPA: lanthionine synthetase LanC family protein, partial [Ktedonobacteraceae bacterium]
MMQVQPRMSLISISSWELAPSRQSRSHVPTLGLRVTTPVQEHNVTPVQLLTVPPVTPATRDAVRIHVRQRVLTPVPTLVRPARRTAERVRQRVLTPALILVRPAIRIAGPAPSTHVQRVSRGANRILAPEPSAIHVSPATLVTLVIPLISVNDLYWGLRLVAKHRVIWKPVITGDLAAEAVQVARDVSSRLRSPEQVAVAAAKALGQTSFPNSTHWIPYSVSQGYAGLAVLWGQLDACFPFEGWDIVGREHLNFAVRGAEAVSRLPLGIFSGLSGLAFGALQLSRNETRYQRLLDTIDQTIVPQTIAMSDSFRGRHNGLGFGDFDVISGLAGVGVYLLCRRDKPAVATALRTAVGSLIELAKDDDAL